MLKATKNFAKFSMILMLLYGAIVLIGVTNNTIDTDETLQSSDAVRVTEEVTKGLLTEGIKSGLKNIALEQSNTEYPDNIPYTQEEILVAGVLEGEIGSSYSYYPKGDLDVNRLYLLSTVMNRIGLRESWNTPTDVVTAPYQYLAYKEPSEESLEWTHRVLSGEVDTMEEVLYEMSFDTTDDPLEATQIMEAQVGDVEVSYYTYTADGRLLMFAKQAE